MCARVLTCPLCSQPGFLTLDALRAGLVSVATRPLICPVCNEVLLGIDKLTIHLFSHTINLNSDIESPKAANVAAADRHLVTIHNAHNIAPQDWNILKQLGKATSGNNKTCAEPLDSHVSNVGNDVSIANSQSKVQNENSSMKGANQSRLVSDSNCDVIKVNILPQSDGDHNAVQKVTTNLQQGALKTNYATQYFCNDNMKQLNIPQVAIQAEKAAISDLIIATKVAGTADANIYQDTERECIESNSGQYVIKKKLIRDLIEEKHDIPNYQSIQSVMVNVCTREFAPEEHNGKENLPSARKTMFETNAREQNQNLEHRQILPHTQTSKAFRTIAPKEKTERCNVCGFHFPDSNILALHKQLVHEQDSNGGPEKVSKNYSCHLCSKVFKMRGSLMVHMRVAHVGHNLGK